MAMPLAYVTMGTVGSVKGDAINGLAFQHQRNPSRPYYPGGGGGGGKGHGSILKFAAPLNAIGAIVSGSKKVDARIPPVLSDPSPISK